MNTQNNLKYHCTPSSPKQENKAVILILIGNLLLGFYPILANFGLPITFPLFFVSVTTLIASLIAFTVTIIKRELGEAFHKKMIFEYLMIILFIMIIPTLIALVGSRGSTEGIDVTFLLMSELVFTMIMTPFFGEKTTALKLIGSAGILLGALFILFTPAIFKLNVFDLIIIFSTITFPLGAFYEKRAMFKVHPEAVLFFRSFFGGLLLLIISFLIEKPQNVGSILLDHWILFLFNGVLLAFLSKALWYRALKSLDISKAIAMNMTYPFFSLIFFALFIIHSVSPYQLAGIILMIIGVYFTIKRRSTDPRKTRYCLEN